MVGRASEGLRGRVNGHRAYAGLFFAGSLCFILLLVGLAGPEQARARELSSLRPKGVTHPGSPDSAAASHSLALLAQVGGKITSVVSDGEYLYVNSGPRLVVLSLEPNPQVVGRSDLLTGNVLEVAVSGETAVVLTDDDLYTIDVSDPNRPIILGHLPSPSFPPATLLAAGDYVYMVVDYALAIVDISIPTRPQLSSKYDTSFFESVSASVQGDLLLLGEYFSNCGRDYCGPEENRIVLIDVSEHSQPRVLAKVPMDVRIEAVALEGDLAYVVTESGMWPFDISDPAQPVELAATPLASDSIDELAVYDGVAYMLAGEELLLYDLSVPTAPELLASLTMPQEGRDLALAGDMTAVAGACGLRMVDVADPHQPVAAGQYVAIEPGSMVLDGDILYIGAGCLQVLDVSELSAPTLLGHLDVGEPIYHLEKVDSLLYVGGRQTLYIFDISQPADPSLMTSYSDYIVFPYFVLAGDYAYFMRFGGDVVTILDVSDPLAPTRVGEYRLPEDRSLFSMAATPGILYLAYSPWGFLYIEIVDVTDPADPSLLATVDTGDLLVGGRYGDMEVAFPHLYVLNNGILRVFDVLDPSKPRHGGTISVDGSAATLILEGDYVYMVGYELLTVYVRPPTTPLAFMTTAACKLGCSGYGRTNQDRAAAQAGILFTGDPFDGLFVYRFTVPEVHGIFFPVLSGGEITTVE